MFPAKNKSYSATGVYGANSTYNSADSPDGLNKYLLSILDPRTWTKNGIPDLDMTQSTMKNNSIESTFAWLKGSFEMLVIFVPASRDKPVRLFVRASGTTDPWAFLGTIALSEPLQDAYRSARLVGAELDVYSSTLPSGSFSINGTINGVKAPSIPPFQSLNYNSLLSYAANTGSSLSGSDVVTGQSHIWAPAGPHNYWVPQTNAVPKFADPVVMRSKDTTGVGWVLTPFTNADQIIWDSDNEPGFLLDPCMGWMDTFFNIEALITVASSGISIFAILEFAEADPLTWNISTGTFSAQEQRMHIDSGDNDIISGGSSSFYQDENVTRMYLRLTSTGGSTVQILRGEVNLTNYSYYEKNQQQPVNLLILKNLETNANVTVSGVTNHEVVPDALLSRNLPTSSVIDDPMEMELAESVLANVGEGLHLVYPRPLYHQLRADGTFVRMATGSGIYGATSAKSIGRKLLGRWKSLNPNLQMSAKKLLGAGVMGGLGALNASTGGVLTPAMPLAGMGVSHYLSADSPQQQNFNRGPPALGYGYGSSMPEEESGYECSDVEDEVGSWSNAFNQLTVADWEIPSPPKENRIFFPIIPTLGNVIDPPRVARMSVSSRRPPQLSTLGNPVEPSFQTIRSSRFTLHVAGVLQKAAPDFIDGLINFMSASTQTGEIYLFHEPYIAFTGRSWELSAFACVAGIKTTSLVTGAVDWSAGGYQIAPVGRLADKTALARANGRRLILPSSCNSGEISGSLIEGEVSIGYAAILVGHTIPSKARILAIDSLSTLCLMSSSGRPFAGLGGQSIGAPDGSSQPSVLFKTNQDDYDQNMSELLRYSSLLSKVAGGEPFSDYALASIRFAESLGGAENNSAKGKIGAAFKLLRAAYQSRNSSNFAQMAKTLDAKSKSMGGSPSAGNSQVKSELSSAARRKLALERRIVRGGQALPPKQPDPYYTGLSSTQKASAKKAHLSGKSYTPTQGLRAGQTLRPPSGGGSGPSSVLPVDEEDYTVDEDIEF